MSKPASDKDNAAPTANTTTTATMADKEGDLAKSDYVPWKHRQRPPGSQAGRYKRFDKSIPNGAKRVLEPGKYDVVFGRGKGSHDHPGNKRMREIIRRHKKDYAAIHRSKKRQIAEFVYSEITQDGARFLHKIKNEDAYAVADLNLALQKLSNTLRCRKSCLIGDDDDDHDDDDAAGEQEDSASVAQSPSTAATPSPVISGSSAISSSIGAAASAAGIQALRHSLASGHAVGQLHHSGLIPPPIGLTHVSALQRLKASDPLLRQRYYGGLAAAAASRADSLLPTTSLAERELLLRRTTALSPLGGGGSALWGRSLLARDPLLPSVASWLPSKEYSELARAEQEYLMVRTRLRAAALGM